MKNTFEFTMPAQLEKGSDGEWKVKGLASTEDKDQQGEVIVQKGIDLTPIDKKQGYFNFDHKPGVENLVGIIDGYNRSEKGLYVEGRLFKNHDKAKAIHQVMSSMTKSDRGRVGLSVEGKILERDPSNPQIIKKCQIKNVAITFNPVNKSTYADLAKSMNSADFVFSTEEEKDSIGLKSEPNKITEEKVFSAKEVVELISKALTAGEAGTKAPLDMDSNGEVLSKEDLDSDIKSVETPKKSKKMKKMCKSEYQNSMCTILDNLQKLYPEYSRTQVWEAVKERLYTKFPDVGKI